jgi:phosphinothricin acetyltransferase
MPGKIAPHVRDSTDADVPAIAEIYAHYVHSSLSTFEIELPSVEEMVRRRAETLANALPYLVAEIQQTVVGYAYAGRYHRRPAYRFTLEDSIYVRTGHVRQGIGAMLLSELIGRTTALGYRQMMAMIGDSANAGSIGLHAAFGFTHVGNLRSVGFKLGRWVDVVFMQRGLGEGARTLPDP